MGLIKANNYSSEEWEISTIAKAIAHPARKRMVEFVISGYCIRNIDLPDMLNLSLTSVNRHLKVLYSSNILRPIYHIHFSEIAIVPETLAVLENYLSSIAKRTAV